MLVLRNATLHDAVCPEAYQADITIERGKIKAIGPKLPKGPCPSGQ